MYILKFHHQLTITILLLLLSTSLTAKDLSQLDWTGIKEEWGQVIFCQRIYKMPEVQPRLYSFDIEHCDKAGQIMTGVATRFSTQEQIALKNQAEQHAILLGQNASEPYHSVVACRELCRDLTEIQDNADD